MRIFVTGATGFIGSAVTKELLGAGHQVLGMTRSAQGEAALKAAGALVHHASIEDLESIARGAASADAVIHLAFNHDFSKFAQNCENDRKVIETLAATLEGSQRPMLVTSGTAIAVATPGHPATETGPTVSSKHHPRALSEETAHAASARGLAVSVVRLPQVHDTTRAGLVSYAARLAREKGVSAYVGEGRNGWAAGHVSDTARLYRLAIEKGTGGANYHAVGEEAVSTREIAEVVGRGLRLPTVSLPPEKAAEHFGWLAMFMGHDMPASSALTQAWLRWKPTGPGLLSDLEKTDFTQL